MKTLRSAIGTPSALIAFEAAGRHLNFSRAAVELNVSQPAISRQIRNLELHIGKRLFARRGNKVAFTEQGRVLFQTTTESFRYIVSAIERIEDKIHDKTLTIRSQPILLATFVLPLMADLRRVFPDFLFDIQSMENSAPLDSERPTIAIMYGDGHWPRMKSVPLFNDVYFPVCHPLMLKGIQAGNAKELLDQLPLLQISTFIDPWMDWRKWGEHFGIDSLKTKRPQYINDYEILLRICRSGQGVALGALHFVYQDLLEGSLVRLTELVVNSDHGFYFVCEPSLTRRREFADLLAWLRDRAKETQRRCLAILRGVNATAASV
jgi:LysR family glycine cleavage system transcriptional activator